jgi:hypothetical protein|tara:strand:- start:685 stop:1083 length:399 start_codon:yes stop_codon:yes gene_type:complete
MKYVHHAVRILTGLLFVAVFASKFGFLPTAANSPEMFTPEGWLLISAIKANGYLFPTIGIISLLCGLAFLVNRYVALAAIVLMPITVNFALFHIFLGLPEVSLREAVPYVFFALNVYMLYSEREKCTGLFKS